MENIGDVTNRGIEISLSTTVLNTQDFNWTVSANLAFEENEITNFPEEERINGSKKLEEGRSIFDFWIRDYAGVNPENGNPMWWRDSTDVDDKYHNRKVVKQQKIMMTQIGILLGLHCRGQEAGFPIKLAIKG